MAFTFVTHLSMVAPNKVKKIDFSQLSEAEVDPSAGKLGLQPP